MSGVQMLGWPARVALGHRRLLVSIVAGVIAYLLLPSEWIAYARAIAAWDIGVIAFLLICAWWFLTSPQERMAADSEAQEEGEWTIFFIFIAATVISFAAIVDVFAAAKDLKGAAKGFVVALVALTLFLSWLVTHVLFALRYAHEYYDLASDRKVIGGLDFPGDTQPDYWDFVYFALVLGMTFQVSDVQITARPLRRLAALHGLLGFLFNAIIIALTVNIAAGLL
jgi:uncharacterized membrane protein